MISFRRTFLVKDCLFLLVAIWKCPMDGIHFDTHCSPRILDKHQNSAE